MKTLIALLLLLVPAVAVAAPDSGDCYTKTITVCPTHKPKHKHAAIVIPAPLVIYKEVPAKCPPALVVTVFRAPACPESKNFVIGGHAAIGFGARDPYVSGMLGLRLRFPKAFLGLEVFSALQYGVGLQALIYVYQGPIVKVHVIDPGVLITGAPFSQLGDPDIHRRADLLLGAGVEVKLVCHLALTADVRVGIPDPVLLADRGSCRAGCRSRIDAAAAVGNAFASTQLFLGLLVHN